MYRLRFLFILLKCFIEPTLPINAERSLRFRAIPLIDTDVARMFTHSYALFMGLARWHLLFGSEFRRLAIHNKWAPVTSSEITTYRRSIRAFQTFNVKTRIVFWNEKRFYVEHLFSVEDQIYVRTLVEGLVRSPAGVLRPNDVFSKAGFAGGSPTISEEEKEQIESLERYSGLKAKA